MNRLHYNKEKQDKAIFSALQLWVHLQPVYFTMTYGEKGCDNILRHICSNPHYLLAGAAVIPTAHVVRNTLSMIVVPQLSTTSTTSLAHLPLTSLKRQRSGCNPVYTITLINCNNQRIDHHHTRKWNQSILPIVCIVRSQCQAGAAQPQ